MRKDHSDAEWLQARVATLERRLEAAQRENVALRHARDVALKLATWGGRGMPDRARRDQRLESDSGVS
jgi:hypothetical protein